MSGYEYAYRVSPARPTGWRSILAGFLTIVTVVAVSGISGAVVTLELIAPKSPPADAPPAVVARASEAPIVQRAAAAVTPSMPATVQPVARDRKPVAQDRKSDQSLHAAVAPVPSVAPSRPQPTIAAAPQAAAPAAKPAAAVPDSELTFAKGYAKRRAAQAAASAASVAAHAADGKVAAVSQLGRAAVPHKPTYARNYASPDARRLAARGDATGYYDRAGPSDFRRHEALAYGEEQRPPRRSEPRGGFFGGMFGNNNMF